VRLHWWNAKCDFRREESVGGQGEMSTPRTWAPAARRAVAVARPMPEEAPVTIMVLLLRSSMAVSGSVVWDWRDAEPMKVMMFDVGMFTPRRYLVLRLMSEFSETIIQRYYFVKVNESYESLVTLVNDGCGVRS
jgi:hypothetical protein